MAIPQFNPETDLKLERVVDLPAELIWKAWTSPELLKQWFCPKPWGVSDCQMDLRPGGRFYTVMLSPEGQTFPNEGCYLEVVPNKRLVWTDTLEAGFHPSTRGHLTDGPTGFYMTGVIELEDLGNGKTRYSAYSLHAKADDAKKHEAMGFSQGWGIVLDQLVELMKKA